MISQILTLEIIDSTILHFCWFLLTGNILAHHVPGPTLFPGPSLFPGPGLFSGPTLFPGPTVFPASVNHRINMDLEIIEITMISILTATDGC